MGLSDNEASLLGFNEKGDLMVEKTQAISDDFVKQCKEDFNNSKKRQSNEMELAASIPTAIYEKWLSEGFDALVEPWKAIKARMKAEGLDYFIRSVKV